MLTIQNHQQNLDAIRGLYIGGDELRITSIIQSILRGDVRISIQDGTILRDNVSVWELYSELFSALSDVLIRQSSASIILEGEDLLYLAPSPICSELIIELPSERYREYRVPLDEMKADIRTLEESIMCALAPSANAIEKAYSVHPSFILFRLMKIIRIR